MGGDVSRYRFLEGVLPSVSVDDSVLQAVAAILFGDVSPSGREVTTWYHAGFINERNMTDMALEPHTAPDGVSLFLLTAC